MKVGDRVTWTSLPDYLGNVTTGFGSVKEISGHQALVVLDSSPREHWVALMDLRGVVEVVAEKLINEIDQTNK